MKKFIVFDVMLSDTLLNDYTNSPKIDEIIKLKYDTWVAGEIGQWCKENKIKIAQEDSYRSAYWMATIIRFSVIVPNSLLEEFEKIVFFVKITTEDEKSVIPYYATR